MKEKRIVMTGGGTAGHVTPNISLLPGLKGKNYRIYYIGSSNGIEKKLIEREGIEYYPISTGKLRRYFDIKNFSDAFKVAAGLFQAYKILGDIKPDVVFSKGGFVSCPVVWASWLRRIPVIIHESDITPGLTNKLSMPFAKKVCYSFPESSAYFDGEKSVLTGLPVRESLLDGDRIEGLKICGFSGEKPVVLVIGGSQGSEAINHIIRDSLEELLQSYKICHICGNGNINTGFQGKKGYRQFEYVNEELPHLFAMADVVVSRAGATVLFELLSLKKPALLIPLTKKASRGDQILNAASFQKSGYSIMLQEEEADKISLINALNQLYKNRDKYIEAMRKNNNTESTSIIINIIDSFTSTGLI
jgi:UDP-N-acetylglucosamine--N-acetylmuramyl-(pentapeptide) pyrophosphoryl-undecaprenol N-acetylglucosamine transferase